jgi:hypothetical protein
MYFKDFGPWVAHIADAFHFESAERARRFVETEHITDVLVRYAEEMVSPCSVMRCTAGS